ncbi:cadherin domain protein [Ancylostoma caninum]|uniref:Cadherin domain protein n=1 Tax=Ancylostoma caninum TaxID=29170 RepID=A0A368G8Z1_ANCCA|nr:cadherin domain protein [Ancylostoma caninum]
MCSFQARDPDRDQVEYAFVDKNGKETYETTLFHIDKDTGILVLTSVPNEVFERVESNPRPNPGLIKLRAGVHATDLLRNDSPYNLTVIARDDGSCCSTESAQHTALATVLIGIEDVNNNKPEFHACASYGEMAKIQEGVYKKDPPVIIKVEATDEDSSSNGQIVYSLYYAQSESRKPFVIDKLTGVLTPSPHVIFDRETRPREDVTVKATDRGDRPLIGFCQFSIEVVDVNDNAPQFDRASYETSISRSETVGTSILTVFAFDNDAPHNANVTYHLEADPSAVVYVPRGVYEEHSLENAAIRSLGEEFQDDASFFRILNEHSGEITLMKPIPRNLKKDKFVFNVVADDNGIPEAQRTTVQVTIKIHEKQQAAPRWQTSPDCKKEVTVVENTEMNKVLLRCRAVAGDGSKSSIVYKLTNGAVSRPGKPDSKFRQFNKIEDGREWVEVVIMEPLDYEQAHNYTLTLTATDVNSHVSSSRSFIVLVEDVNDVVPQFTVDLFTGTVDEELTPAEYLEKFDRKPITTVKAVDSDSNGPQNEVHYRILDVPDNSGAQLFRIDELTGEIWPNAKFDREQKDMYILTVEARDNLPSALPGATGPNKDNVKVQIVIGDVNDNAPSFDEPKYVGKVLENADPGHDIITIKAHDMDKHSTLRYDVVAAQGGRIPFGARTDSGAIFVKEPLDYEQESVYHLRLLVSDGRHNASTDVFIYVEDVNDNAPVFEQPSYSTTILEEDPDIPKVLFHVRATDADKDEKSRRIVYLLEGQGAGEFFRIGRETGDIELVKALDRDPPNGVPTWNFIVQAIDDDGRGLIGYADVQVNLKDINDNAPIFADDLYGYVEENREPHSRDGVYFMDVRATDYDDPTTDNAKLEYSIVLNKEIDGVPVFRIDPFSGKIFAMRALDRELPSEREFVIEVRATDRGTPPREGKSLGFSSSPQTSSAHYVLVVGAANVTIKVLDKNDNAPSFERTQYDAVVAETAPVGAAVISVSATDPDDEAIDNLFTYTLADDSKYFYMTTDRDSSDSYVGVLRVKRVSFFSKDFQVTDKFSAGSGLWIEGSFVLMHVSQSSCDVSSVHGFSVLCELAPFTRQSCCATGSMCLFVSLWLRLLHYQRNLCRIQFILAFEPWNVNNNLEELSELLFENEKLLSVS